MSILNLARLAVVAAIGLLTITGCDRIGTEAGGHTQVIARVNGSEVSLLQYAHVLERAGISNPGSAVRREIAEKLVDREIAMQQALAAKLDRRPEVMLALEEARRDVLARAWAEQTAAEAGRPGDNQAATYFSQHPELFSQRKIYRLREATLSADAPQRAEARTRFAQGASIEQVSAWLRQEGTGFNAQVVIRAAEQLPIEALPRLVIAREGQTVLFESPRGLIAYQVLGTQPAPVRWNAAHPIIVDYLSRQAGKHAVVARMQQLRAGSEIAYLGEFSALFGTQAGTGR